MAEGLVLVLTGALCKQKAAYAGHDKTYGFTVLLGVKTDTGDVLGKISNTNEKMNASAPDNAMVSAAIARALSREAWPYPAFSSKPVGGVPLFARAKAGSLPESLPVQKGKLLKLRYLATRIVPADVLRSAIIHDVALVAGDFRQEEIIAGWQQWQCTSVALLDFEAVVSSGFYIRSLAEYLAECLGTPGLAYAIMRTSIDA